MMRGHIDSNWISPPDSHITLYTVNIVHLLTRITLRENHVLFNATGGYYFTNGQCPVHELFKVHVPPPPSLSS